MSSRWRANQWPARPSRRGAPAPAFSTAQWASLSEAFARAKASLGSHRLAERDLLEHMRSGRLATAERRIAGDGAELFVAVAPSFFATAVLTARNGDVEIVEIDALIPRPSGVEATTDEPSSFRAFFVARSDLDKLYPVDAAANQETECRQTAANPGRGRNEWKLVRRRGAASGASSSREAAAAGVKMASFARPTAATHPDLHEMQYAA